MRRFYSPNLSDSDDHVHISGEEVRHIAAVTRHTPGDRIIVFDGSGLECVAEIEEVGRDRLGARILERRRVELDTPVHVTVASAVPRGKRSQYLVEKLTELGVARLVFTHTARCVTRPGGDGGAMRRWEKAGLEALKQCGRNVAMRIDLAPCFADVVKELAGAHVKLVGVAVPEARPLRDCLEAASSGSVALIVGPEGGFTSEELELAAASGFVPVRFGPRVLRIETAGVVLAGAVMYRFSSSKPLA